MRAIILALAAAALFGAASPLGKYLLTSFSPFQLAGLLYLGAFLGVAPQAASQTGLRGLFSIPPSSKWKLAVALILGGIFGPIFFLCGLQLASAASVSLWLTLEAAFTAVIAVFLFREHLGRSGWLGVGGAIAAAGALSLSEGTASIEAGFFVALACLCWAIDNNLTSVIDGLPPAGITLIRGLVAGTINLAIGLHLSALHCSVQPVVLALIVGAFCYGLSLTFYIAAAQSLGAARCQMIFASAPFWGVAISTLFLKEALGLQQMAAAAVLICSIAALLRDRHEHAHQHEAVEHVHEHAHDDGHHEHQHQEKPASFRHSHWHKHDATSHAHRHWPDLHHRHHHR